MYIYYIYIIYYILFKNITILYNALYIIYSRVDLTSRITVDFTSPFLMIIIAVTYVVANHSGQGIVCL